MSTGRSGLMNFGIFYNGYMDFKINYRATCINTDKSQKCNGEEARCKRII